MYDNRAAKPEWMVLYTKPRAEKRAYSSLLTKGYAVYLPLTTVIKQWSDRKKKVEEPLFRSYLFIRCLLNQITAAAREDTIVGVVRFNGSPAIVREEEIETIRRIEAGKDEVAVADHSMLTGQRVLIKEGKLKGLSGILAEFRGAQRVAIEIESLNCNLWVEVPAANIQKQ